MIRRRLAALLVILFLFGLGWGWRSETAVRGKSFPHPLDQPLTMAQGQAQALALADPEVQSKTWGQRAEVFGVRALGSHYPATSQACANRLCQQVEIYNFDTNTTILSLVDPEMETVLAVLDLPHMQPGINKRLADKALEIGLTHPEVTAELGFQPSAKDLDMAPVAAGLRGSRCDRHLCAALTFRVENRVLWAIIDLTSDTLVGVNWTEVITDGPFVHIAEQGACPAPGTVDDMGWQLSYETTGTDGLDIFDAAYMGQDVIESAKLAEWHVDYNGSYHIAGFLDVTGCGGGGGGFFIFPYGETVVVDLVEDSAVVGFEVRQDFRMDDWGAACHYRYEQRMQFYQDGRFRIVSGAFGRGCGFSPVYRPVVRLDLALDANNQEQVGYWDGEQWQLPPTERIFSPDRNLYGPAGHPVADNEAMLWLMNQNGAGYYMVPGQGQFNDSGRGDEPFVYLTKYAAAEGAADLPIFSGLCCENDFQQGPHYFVNEEAVQNENVVIWYVAQHETAVNQTDASENYCWTVSGEPTPESYPCYGGPLFVPFGYEGTTLSAEFSVDDTDIVFPEVAQFDNQSIVTGQSPVNYIWDFGDGGTAFEENPSHLYLKAGVFIPSLTLNGFLNGQDTQIGTSVQVAVKNLFLPLITSK